MEADTISKERNQKGLMCMGNFSAMKRRILKYLVLVIFATVIGNNIAYSQTDWHYWVVLERYFVPSDARNVAGELLKDYSVNTYRIVLIENETGYYLLYNPSSGDRGTTKASAESVLNSFKDNRPTGIPRPFVKRVLPQNMTIIYPYQNTTTTQTQSAQSQSNNQPTQNYPQQQQSNPQIKNYYEGNNDISIFLKDRYSTGSSNDLMCRNYTGRTIKVFVSYTITRYYSNGNVENTKNVSFQECPVSARSNEQIVANAYWSTGTLGYYTRITSFKVEKYIIY